MSTGLPAIVLKRNGEPLRCGYRIAALDREGETPSLPPSDILSIETKAAAAPMAAPLPGLDWID